MDEDDPASMGYRVYFFGGRPVVSAPNVPRRLRRAALRHYPAETHRRRLFKNGLRAAAALGLDGLISRYVKAPPFPHPFDFIGWMEEVRRLLGHTDLYASVVWPPPARSTTRVYIHLLTGDGTRVAFAKVSFDSDNDNRLQNEADALAKHSARRSGFVVPAVLTFGQHRDHRFLVTESLPTDVRSVDCSWDFAKRALVDHYAGATRVLGSMEVESLDWWKHFLTVKGVESDFVQELIRIGINDVQVCHAHGDFAPHNIAFAGNDIWLFDWEESNDNAPYLTDEIRFYLAVHQRHVMHNPARGTRAFVHHFRIEDVRKRRAVMMALAFLHAAGIDAASKIIEYW